jgi:integrase/recombinase XerC
MGKVLRLANSCPAPRMIGAGANVPLIVRAHLEWMRQRGLAESTIDKRRLVLARVARFTQHRAAWEATPAELAAWRASLTAGDDAVAADLSHVRMFFRWLVDEQLLDTDPSAGLAAPRLASRLPRPIPEDRLLLAVDEAPPRIRPMLVLAGWCGLRAKEIALLRRERIFETRTPPVILVASDATKGKSERYVPLSDYVLTELLPVLPVHGWVFRRKSGGHLSPDHLQHIVNDYLRSLGFPERLHTLRHRFATEALDACGNVRTVQELLGHRHLSSTAIYTRVSSAAALAAVEAIPAPRHLRVVSEG